MNPTEVKTMNDLPELPFAKVLSHLSLEDRFRARTVSQGWRKKFDFKMESLCYSERPSDFIGGKKRWISGVFAQNFIYPSRQFLNTFSQWIFFDTFSQSILSNLKHLRLCELTVTRWAEFAQSLNSLGQLEKLDIIQCNVHSESKAEREFKLILPMLNSIRLDEVLKIEKVTLDSPRLQKIELLQSMPLRLDLVHGESVERLVIQCLKNTEWQKLKNLKYLYTDYDAGIDLTFLFGLEKLKEIHLGDSSDAKWLFEQKQRYGRADLKIFLDGLLLNSQNEIVNLRKGAYFGYLAENLSRLADEIPISNFVSYAERVYPGLMMNVQNRYIDLNKILVDEPVQDTERFLDYLKKHDRIIGLALISDQPQDLFDRLPEHCEVQCLFIEPAPADLGFLFRLNHLIHLNLSYSIDAELIRRIFEKLPFLWWFLFQYNNRKVSIKIDPLGKFKISVVFSFDEQKTVTSDLSAAIEFIIEKTKPEYLSYQEDLEDLEDLQLG